MFLGAFADNPTRARISKLRRLLILFGHFQCGETVRFACGRYDFSSEIYLPSANNPATLRLSALGVSEESNVQSVAVAVSTLEAEADEFLLSRSDPPFIYTFGHEEDF